MELSVLLYNERERKRKRKGKREIILYSLFRNPVKIFKRKFCFQMAFATGLFLGRRALIIRGRPHGAGRPHSKLRERRASGQGRSTQSGSPGEATWPWGPARGAPGGWGWGGGGNRAAPRPLAPPGVCSGRRRLWSGAVPRPESSRYSRLGSGR